MSRCGQHSPHTRRPSSARWRTQATETSSRRAAWPAVSQSVSDGSIAIVGTGVEATVARDSGVTEYLIKPFTAKVLLERVNEIVENPRSFVLCKNYIGPDRRRTSSPNAASSPPSA